DSALMTRLWGGAVAAGALAGACCGVCASGACAEGGADDVVGAGSCAVTNPPRATNKVAITDRGTTRKYTCLICAIICSPKSTYLNRSATSTTQPNQLNTESSLLRSLRPFASLRRRAPPCAPGMCPV